MDEMQAVAANVLREFSKRSQTMHRKVSYLAMGGARKKASTSCVLSAMIDGEQQNE